jgi:hypothetical protein
MRVGLERAQRCAGYRLLTAPLSAFGRAGCRTPLPALRPPSPRQRGEGKERKGLSIENGGRSKSSPSPRCGERVGVRGNAVRHFARDDRWACSHAPAWEHRSATLSVAWLGFAAGLTERRGASQERFPRGSVGTRESSLTALGEGALNNVWRIPKFTLHIMIQSLAPHWAGTCVAVGQAFQPDSAGRQAGKPDLLRNRLTENSVGALTNWVI